jgi:glycosyltransferase involved in cell wall biosynthesis
MLLEHGLDVMVETEWYGGHEARWMVALNARRSAGAVEEFRDACPEGRVAVVLTGTDINHSEMEDPSSRTRETMRVADWLVLLHEGSLPLVPEDLRGKCWVIYPSVSLPEGLRHEHSEERDGFRVVMAGNVREEKNLPVVMDACGMLGEHSPVSVTVYGESQDDLATQMCLAERVTPCFRWAGKLEHGKLLRKMAGADALLNSSTQEGGANAICEAICLGLPVLASQISGNVGMLGEDYDGYFESGNADALAELLTRLSGDVGFYTRLKKQIEVRAPLFSYEEESKLWLKLLGRGGRKELA